MTTLTLNKELNGIEIKFDCKPISSTLESLKRAVSGGTARKNFGTQNRHQNALSWHSQSQMEKKSKQEPRKKRLKRKMFLV